MVSGRYGFKRMLGLVVVEAEMCQAESLWEAFSADPDDDKFIACALSSGRADCQWRQTSS